ncbi:helix-turn-helix domain-containing protein [Domibacillus aminovorans]|uniref:helix-turn-helix domain-containing protein n=1 Tax=Domibacillus aminovorans TaxID=29332 RepID=UPI003D25C8B0
MNYLSVRDVSIRLGKSEETVKRWIRKGKLSAKKNSDREGWLILESDLEQITRKKQQLSSTPSVLLQQQVNEKELIALAFQGVTLLQPTQDILDVLSEVRLKRALEVLLVMRQSPKPVKNPLGFIRKAIRENWTPETIPVRIVKNQAARRNEPTRKEMVPDWLHNGQDHLSKGIDDSTFEEDKKRLEESLKNRRSDGIL